MISRPDIIEELNLHDGFQSTRRHAYSATDDIRFSQRRIKDTRRAELSLKIRCDLEDAALAFDLFQILLARDIRHVFAEDYDRRVSSHLLMHAAIDEID